MFFTLLKTLTDEFSFPINQGNLGIRIEQIRARLRFYPVMILLQAIAEPLFVYLFWNRTDHLSLLVWLLCIYVIHAGDILLWMRQREPVNSISDCKRWRNNFNLFTLLTALTWGSIALWFYPSELEYEAIMICIALGLVSGAVTFDSVYLPALYIYIAGVTLPLLFRIIHSGGDTHWVLAALLVLFLIASVSAGRELGKSFLKSLWQRHENDYLIEELTRQKVIAELASRDKSRFLASASHDLRQPLQALVLFSESLQDVSKDADTRHLASQINKSVGALVDMFDELLDISKLDAGVIKANLHHFPIQPMFDRLATDFQPLAQAKGLHFEMPPCSLAGNSDPILVERILRNLISNAIRYTDFGKISISCELVDSKLKFDVRDTGIGIRAQSLPHIFEEYYQVDNQHRDRLKGLGLGLAIVRRIEGLIDTKVSVSSRPALGSTFTFHIAPGEIARHTLAVTSAPPRNDVSGTTVALVDDNHDIRVMITGLMNQWGCKVYDGDLPTLVLQTMSADGVRPDLLICDYRLPNELTALDGIRQLRTHWSSDIPTIILTGDTAPQTLKDIEASGAYLLHKPISPARLRSIMYFALNREKPSIPLQTPQ